jgi:hypothetical protein
MKTTLYNVTVPVSIKLLLNLRAMLDKTVTEAAAKKYDLDHLLTDRLAPDMFPFVRQVTIACDHAKMGAAKLAGMEWPKMEDNEKTVDELKARIDKTVEFLKTITPEQFADAETRKITVSYIPGKYFEGYDFALEYMMPNVYFHVVAAYALLRHNGISVGKADYAGGLTLKDVA